jgi:activator of HSP90 ATPase
MLEVLTDPKSITRYTRSKAESEPKAGGRYSIFDGSISGTYEEATAVRELGVYFAAYQFYPTRMQTSIKMKWRLNNWTEGKYSDVHITLAPKGEGQTSLELKQTSIPVDVRSSRSLYFDEIRELCTLSQDKFGHLAQEESVERGWRERIFGSIKQIVGISFDDVER